MVADSANRGSRGSGHGSKITPNPRPRQLQTCLSPFFSYSLDPLLSPGELMTAAIGTGVRRRL